MREIGGLGVEGDVADLVDDQQRDALQPIEFVIEAAVALGVGQQRHPLGGGLERHSVPCQAGADPQRDGQVRLAGAGRAEQDDALLTGQEVELGEVQDRVLRAGNFATLLRAWPPWLSRESVSVFSSAAPS